MGRASKSTSAAEILFEHQLCIEYTIPIELLEFTKVQNQNQKLSVHKPIIRITI